MHLKVSVKTAIYAPMKGRHNSERQFLMSSKTGMDGKVSTFGV